MNIVLSTLFLHNAFLIPSWVEYHTSLGVDYFYLYYHGKINDDLISLTSKYQNVELIEWDVGHDNAWGYAQESQLWHTAAKAKNNFNWVGNFDLDEFIILNDVSNIKDFLSVFDLQKDFYLKFGCKWSKLKGLPNKKYLEMKIKDFMNYETIISHNSHDGRGINDAGLGKYIYNIDLLRGRALLDIHNINLGHPYFYEQYPEVKCHEVANQAYYNHYKKDYTNRNGTWEFYDWALDGMKCQKKVNNRIKELIDV